MFFEHGELINGHFLDSGYVGNSCFDCGHLIGSHFLDSD